MSLRNHNLAQSSFVLLHVSLSSASLLPLLASSLYLFFILVFQMSRKSTRSHSARHLSDDYVWDSLSPLLSDPSEDSPTFNPIAYTKTAVSTDLSSGLPLLADQSRRQKLAPMEIPKRSEKVLLSVPLPPSATAISLPQSSR